MCVTCHHLFLVPSASKSRSASLKASSSRACLKYARNISASHIHVDDRGLRGNARHVDMGISMGMDMCIKPR